MKIFQTPRLSCHQDWLPVFECIDNKNRLEIQDGFFVVEQAQIKAQGNLAGAWRGRCRML